MRKNLSILIAGIAVCALFTACGKETEQASDNAAANSSQAAEATSDVTAEAAASDLTIDFDNLDTKNLEDYTASDFVKLADYNGITVEAVLQEVTDADVDAYINELLASNPPMIEVTDRAVQDGDTVNIDYVGKYADTKEAFDGGTASGADLVIGSNSYIEGFESGLIGVKKGETVDLNLTFPENYGATDLAGKDVIFTVTVNSISTASTDITDEGDAGLGIENVSKLTELKAYAVEILNEQALETYNSTIENTAVQNVLDNSVFSDIPEELVNRYLIQQNELVEYYANMYSYMYGSNVSVGDLLSVYMQNDGFTGTADEYLYSMAEEVANQYIAFQSIADEQGITVTDAEIDEYLKEAYESASTTAFSSFEDYKASLDLETYREGLMSKKVVEFIVENANVVGTTTAAE